MKHVKLPDFVKEELFKSDLYNDRSHLNNYYIIGFMDSSFVLHNVDATQYQAHFRVNAARQFATVEDAKRIYDQIDGYAFTFNVYGGNKLLEGNPTKRGCALVIMKVLALTFVEEVVK